MTIQDALERAKQLRRSREERPAALGEREPVVREVPGVIVVGRDPCVNGPMEAVPYPDLDRVTFDEEACQRSKILFTSAQLTEGAGAAAAYRLVRSRVLHRFKGSNWNSIGITSPSPGDGKTVTAVNLALSIARDKQRMVYLLDLDMRNPSAFESVGVHPTRAVSQYFTDRVAPEKILFSTSVENLVMAGNREAVPGASELLSSPRLDELLAYIRRRSPGALTLIDLPPVLATDEALVVAPRIDALFLVVSEGVTRRESVTKAVDVLSDFAVAGIIMNRSSEHLGGGYYGYGG